MNVSATFERIARAAARHRVAVLAAAAVLTLGGGLLAALTLRPNAGTDTLADRGSASAQATSEYHKRFGEESIVILVREHLPELLDTSDLGRLIELEYCLSGQVPPGGFPAYFRPRDGGPCDKLGRSRAVKVVYGPGTFLKKSVDEITTQVKGRAAQTLSAIQQAGEQAAAAAKSQGLSRRQQAIAAQTARYQAQQQAAQQLQQLAVQTGLTGVPRIDDPSFINRVVFDPTRGTDVPKARFAYLFPNSNAAVIQVRLHAGLSDNERARVIGLVEDAVHLPDPRAPGREAFALQNGHGSYLISGVPVVVAALAHEISSALTTLLLAALLVMAATLALVFRTRLRLLPLAVALAATGLTFGAMALAGVSLTMGAVAVLPVLIGLGVDYAIQFQTRVHEAEEEEGGAGERAVVRGARAGGATIATAALATGVGFLVLALSPVPMVRGFGLLLVLGIVLALGCALTAGAAALALPAPRWARGSRLAAAAREAGDLIDEGWRRAARAAPVRRVSRAGTQGLAAAVRRPQRFLAIGLALAVLGWVADTQINVESDIERLVPQSLPALQDLRTLERVTGVSGEVDVTVHAADLTDPKVVSWMTDYQQRILTRFGYDPARGCQKATLCPALSLPDLFGTVGAQTGGSQIKALLDSVPPYFSQAVITPDRRVANLAFGVRQLPLSEQQRVIEEMRRDLHPPPGVTARLAGLSVLVADANDKLSSPPRRLGTLLLGLLAVGLALYAVFRRLERVLVPLLPIAMATGWSSLVLLPLSAIVPLNPMSATLGALVIAISTEFSVLLSERYRQERAAGHAEPEALRRTYASTGRAVLASGLTAIAGFGILAVSDIALLRNFGVVTVLDLAISLLGVLLVLPAVLQLAERGELYSLPARAWRALGERWPPARRRSRTGIA